MLDYDQGEEKASWRRWHSNRALEDTDGFAGGADGTYPPQRDPFIQGVLLNYRNVQGPG